MKTTQIFAAGLYPENCTDPESLDELVTEFLDNQIKGDNHVKLITGISNNFELLCALSAMRLNSVYSSIDYEILLTGNQYAQFFTNYNLSPDDNLLDEYIAITEASKLHFATNLITAYRDILDQSDIFLYFPDIGINDYVFRHFIKEALKKPGMKVIDILKT